MESQRSAEPLLTVAQAAAHLEVPRSTITQWAAAGLLHGVVRARRFEPTMPLVAVAQAQVLDGLRQWGLRPGAIRAASARLRREFGPYGLLTQRLATDGAALLRGLPSRDEDQHRSDDGQHGDATNWERVVDGQAMLPQVVDDHVHYFEWDHDGYPQRLTLRSYARRGADVVLDPRFGYGQPVFAATKARVSDVVRQFAAGEPHAEIAADYGLTSDDVAAAVAVLGTGGPPTDDGAGRKDTGRAGTGAGNAGTDHAGTGAADQERAGTAGTKKAVA